MQRFWILLLFLSTAAFASNDLSSTVDLKSESEPEHSLIVYTPFPPDFTYQFLKPLIEFIEQKMGLNVIIPRGECEVAERFNASKEALVLPIFPMWRPLLEKNYVPLVETANPFSVTVISKRGNTFTLQDLHGQRVAIDPSFSEHYQPVFEHKADGIWSTMNIVDVVAPNYSHLSVLNGEAEYGVLARTVWNLTAPSIKEKLNAIEVSAKLPVILIMSHPQLSDNKKKHYQQALITMHEHIEQKQWLEKLDFGQFIPVNLTTADYLNGIQTEYNFKNCQSK